MARLGDSINTTVGNLIDKPLKNVTTNLLSRASPFTPVSPKAFDNGAARKHLPLPQQCKMVNLTITPYITLPEQEIKEQENKHDDAENENNDQNNDQNEQNIENAHENKDEVKENDISDVYLHLVDNNDNQNSKKIQLTSDLATMTINDIRQKVIELHTNDESKDSDNSINTSNFALVWKGKIILNKENVNKSTLTSVIAKLRNKKHSHDPKKHRKIHIFAVFFNESIMKTFLKSPKAAANEEKDKEKEVANDNENENDDAVDTNTSSNDNNDMNENNSSNVSRMIGDVRCLCGCVMAPTSPKISDLCKFGGNGGGNADGKEENDDSNDNSNNNDHHCWMYGCRNKNIISRNDEMMFECRNLNHVIESGLDDNQINPYTFCPIRICFDCARFIYLLEELNSNTNVYGSENYNEINSKYICKDYPKLIEKYVNVIVNELPTHDNVIFFPIKQTLKSWDETVRKNGEFTPKSMHHRVFSKMIDDDSSHGKDSKKRKIVTKNTIKSDDHLNVESVIEPINKMVTKDIVYLNMFDSILKNGNAFLGIKPKLPHGYFSTLFDKNLWLECIVKNICQNEYLFNNYVKKLWEKELQYDKIKQSNRIVQDYLDEYIPVITQLFCNKSFVLDTNKGGNNRNINVNNITNQLTKIAKISQKNLFNRMQWPLGSKTGAGGDGSEEAAEEASKDEVESNGNDSKVTQCMMKTENGSNCPVSFNIMNKKYYCDMCDNIVCFGHRTDKKFSILKNNFTISTANVCVCKTCYYNIYQGENKSKVLFAREMNQDILAISFKHHFAVQIE